MKSSIKIDFKDNGQGLEPVFAIKLIQSDDVRDTLLKTFFQRLGGESSWLSVSFDHHIEGIDGTEKRTFISLHPVTPAELPETIKIIQSRITSDKDLQNFSPLKDEKSSL